MAKENETRKKVIEKRTNQGGARPKTSSMSKYQKRGFKPYRGQGK